ncbi:hypothetical protein T01_14203 [Trichinella spiralis]|uniref:Uncharacterized protein n=1 Tax=Trichinella spiralis TaxID=6334 RepID=A0A0V1AW73_TRISP|nr:hypothetical protein T01_14203 [Trichinella spiralis]
MAIYKNKAFQFYVQPFPILKIPNKSKLHHMNIYKVENEYLFSTTILLLIVLFNFYYIKQYKKLIQKKCRCLQKAMKLVQRLVNFLIVYGLFLKGKTLKCDYVLENYSVASKVGS